MKKNAVAGTLVLCMIVVLSCRKKASPQSVEEPVPTTPVVYENYSSLEPGSYWIYKQRTISGSDTSNSSITDSSYVWGDTLIRGQKYYKFFNGFYHTSSYIRDSLHYTINHLGQRLFSSVDFDSHLDLSYTILNMPPAAPDTMYISYVQMSNANPDITVPAGKFTTLDAQTVTRQYKSSAAEPKISHAKYAAKVGLVYATYNFASGNVFVERSLVRYNLK